MEQTITMAIEAAKTCLKEQSELCTSLEQKAANFRSLCPSYEKFCVTYNPVRQINFGADERAALMQESSAVSILDAAYGPGSSASWLAEHIGELNTFSGSKNMDDEQVKNLARMIAAEYKDMKLSEIMLFFYKFKIGYFGKFWGKVDPMVITCALKDFKEEINMKRQELLTEGYLNKVAEEGKYREAVYRNWYNLCQELFSRIEAKDIDALSSIDVKKIYVEEKCLEISISKHQLELLTGTYNDLFNALKKRYFSNLVKKLRYNFND